jgi:hypothetical protein
VKDPELMQRHDGELDDVSPAPESIDPVARAKADALVELGELVRGHLETRADAVPDKRFAAMWREIDKAIDREHDEASVGAAIPRPHAAPAGMWRRLGRWFDQYRGHLVTGAVSAGAVAALAILLRGGAATDDGTKPGSHGAIDVTPAAYHPTEIEELDTPGGTGTVFDLKDEDGSSTVIWVTPSDTVEGI